MSVATPISDENDTIIATLKLRSGRFESSIEIPLQSTEGERKAFIESWMNLMVVGLRVGTGATP